jgi:hypothetical protein
MNSLMILVGPDADSNPYFMDLASVAAELAMESGRRILFAGTSETILAVGTALSGKQQGRTLEGGERLPSPMVLFGLVRSAMDKPDPLYREPDWRETDSNGEMPHHEGGLLSDLIDFGIMDLANGMKGRIIPMSFEELAFQLNHLLKQEEPSQTLVIGHVSEEMIESLSHHAKESNMRLGIIGGQAPEGAEALNTEVGEPLLDGVPIRGVEQGEQDTFRGETASSPLFEAAKNAVWEAGLSHAVTVWVQGKGRSRNQL